MSNARDPPMKCDWGPPVRTSNPDPFPMTNPTAPPTPTPTPQPGGGISLRTTAAGNNGAGSSTLTIGLPAGTQSGDVMVAFVVVRQANKTITPPARGEIGIASCRGRA